MLLIRFSEYSFMKSIKPGSRILIDDQTYILLF